MTGQSACGIPRVDSETAVRWWAAIVTDRVRPWVTLKFDAAQPEVLLVILMLAAEPAPAAMVSGDAASLVKVRSSGSLTPGYSGEARSPPTVKSWSPPGGPPPPVRAQQ